MLDRRNDFFHHLSWKARATFMAAVFVTFAALGTLLGRGLEVDGVGRTLAWTVFSGVVAVGWAWAFTRDLRLLFLVIPFSFLAPPFIGRPSLRPVEIITIALVVLGYILFVVFINTEGVRSLRLRTEVTLASELHTRLVPSIELATDHVEAFGASLSCTEVGGDLLDVFQTEDGIGLYVADVSGHGVAAGTLMGMTKSALRMRLLDPPPLEQLVANLNEVVCKVRKRGMFVTFAALELDLSGRARWALAGHLPILHFRPSTGEVLSLSDPNPPLGVSPKLTGSKRFRSHEVEVSSGDVFALLTDGLTEVRDSSGEELGIAPIEALMVQHTHEPLADLHARILQVVERHGQQEDDRTLLLARIR